MNKHFITQIYIEKIRHLKNIKIDLSDKEQKHLILTGINGSGKTTLIETIKKYLEFIIEDINKNGSYEIDIKFNLNDKNLLRSLYKQGKFILGYYNSSRSIDFETPTGVQRVKLKNTYTFDENPSKLFLKYLVDLKAQQSFARNEEDMEVVENIDNWFDKFENAMRTILDDDSIKLKFDYRNYTFKILQDNREPYGFDELSDGYSSVLSILCDLILRINKNRSIICRDYEFDTEGIVLIDNIEANLYVELQNKILPFFVSFFPNIQFIVTTHSPFVLNSIDNAIIYDLGKND